VKPLRYVVIKDELKLNSVTGNNKFNGALDLFQFIYSLLYTYTFSIPFPLGGTSQPAPIVYAKHYAEVFSQMISSHDHCLHDLQLANNLINRPHVIEKVIAFDETNKNQDDIDKNDNSNKSIINISNKSKSNRNDDTASFTTGHDTNTDNSDNRGNVVMQNKLNDQKKGNDKKTKN